MRKLTIILVFLLALPIVSAAGTTINYTFTADVGWGSETASDYVAAPPFRYTCNNYNSALWKIIDRRIKN